eukprot:tig00000241_g21045.t1
MAAAWPPPQPITEMSSSLTSDLDLETPAGMVRRLAQCDEEVYAGWEGQPGCLAPETVHVVDRIAAHAESVLRHPGPHAIVMSGAGTSGRLALFLARSFNRVLRAAGRPPAFHFLMAGGDKAFFKAQESAEDNPTQAVEDLRARLREAGCDGEAARVLYVGISCGMSATYVAGQLDYLMHRENCGSVLLGFNPVELARKVRVAAWERTFHDVAAEQERLSRDPAHASRRFVLAPIVGPEPVAGSTRMKGGTATLVILAAAWAAALRPLLGGAGPPSSAPLLRSFAAVKRAAYADVEALGRLVAAAGAALRAPGGRLCTAGPDVLGLLALVDASECPPTYGAAFEDVQGFLPGGLAAAGDLASAPPLTPRDALLLLAPAPSFEEGAAAEEAMQGGPLAKYAERSAASGAPVCAVAIDFGAERAPVPAQAAPELVARICLPRDGEEDEGSPAPLRAEMRRLRSALAAKYALNAVSTGAHVLKGKVYMNFMVDLKVSNNKLFHRAAGLVRRFFPGVGPREAVAHLVTAIYLDEGRPPASPEADGDPDAATVAAHIAVAVTKPQARPARPVATRSRARARAGRPPAGGAPRPGARVGAASGPPPPPPSAPSPSCAPSFAASPPRAWPKSAPLSRPRAADFARP